MIFLLVALSIAVLFAAWEAAQRVREQKEWREERRNLLDRIQAPHQAVIKSLVEEEDDEPLHVRFDDDEDFHGTR